ncbi:MAG: ABC transporter permease subunit, partial [Anaerolineae bacterium]
MNILFRELKANLRSLIIWAVIVILFVTVGISKFSAYYNNPEMLVILDKMPPALMQAFSFQAFNLTTIEGFFGVMFTYYGLLLSIAAAMWGSDIISKEERDKTVEFALTLPVTRSRVVTAKALAALVNCIGLLLVTWATSLVSSAQYEPGSDFYHFLALSMLALFLMQLIFLAIGLFLGCAMKQYRRASSVAVSLLLGTYVVSVVSGLDQSLDFLKYFSPFKYFDPGVLLRESRIDIVFVGLSLAIILASMVG